MSKKEGIGIHGYKMNFDEEKLNIIFSQKTLIN